jgi:hypothetical protein
LKVINRGEFSFPGTQYHRVQMMEVEFIGSRSQPSVSRA